MHVRYGFRFSGDNNNNSMRDWQQWKLELGTHTQKVAPYVRVALTNLQVNKRDDDRLLFSACHKYIFDHLMPERFMRANVCVDWRLSAHIPKKTAAPKLTRTWSNNNG